jgi:light-regulated signal transduction histidine kinase (bacteriophytochrome)
MATSNTASGQEWRWRHRFVSDVYHALSQPLTALHCSLELALTKQQSPQEQNGALRDALMMAATAIESAKFLRLMVEAEDPGDVKPVLLARMLRDIRDELNPIAETQGTEIVWSCDTETVVNADPPRLREALFLLTDSALQWAGKQEMQMELLIRRKCALVRIGAAETSSGQAAPGCGSYVTKPILLAQKIIHAAGGEVMEQLTRNGFSWIITLPRVTVPSGSFTQE